MYELLDINQNIITDFFKALANFQKKKNWGCSLFLAVKQTFHSLYPELPMYVFEPYMQKLLQPIYDREKYNIHTRDFIDEAEGVEVYHSTYNQLIEELSNSQLVEDQYNLDLIDYIYELLHYDQVTIIDGEKYLSSFINLSFWGQQHIEGYEKLEELRKAKPLEGNIDTATNSNKAPKDKVKFLNEKFNLQISNPHIDSKEEELQQDLLSHYGKDFRMIARSIYGCSQIPKDVSEHFETKAIGRLEAYVNSDGEITQQDLYMSWYAYTFNIYKMLSKDKIPVKKALEVAKLSSYVIFPDLRKFEDPLYSSDTAKKPIRERAFFKGLRLQEFTDNRLRIKRSEDEIKFYEEYLKTITYHLKKLS